MAGGCVKFRAAWGKAATGLWRLRWYQVQARQMAARRMAPVTA
ncbi:hypothetical protein [Komagataeibacter melaceti]|nr:hypothetical protein [Komagataeibacter melaceti]